VPPPTALRQPSQGPSRRLLTAQRRWLLHPSAFNALRAATWKSPPRCTFCVDSPHVSRVEYFEMAVARLARVLVPSGSSHVQAKQRPSECVAASATNLGPTTVTAATAALNGAHAPCASVTGSCHHTSVLPSRAGDPFALCLRARKMGPFNFPLTHVSKNVENLAIRPSRLKQEIGE
jgi:hypothetical protein